MDKKKAYSCDPDGWVQAYSDEFFRYAFSRMSHREEAEDVVQETFFAALKNLDNFRRDCSEKTWLYNILKNRIIDYYRKKAVKSKVTDTVNSEHEFYASFFADNGYWHETGMPKPWHKEADHDLSNEEFMRILAYCMERLPELGLSVFSLKNMDDKTTDEICKELEITPSNLWVIIHRAKLQLRGCLEKNWFNQ